MRPGEEINNVIAKLPAIMARCIDVDGDMIFINCSTSTRLGSADKSRLASVSDKPPRLLVEGSYCCVYAKGVGGVVLTS